jgi:hypothetical protein
MRLLLHGRLHGWMCGRLHDWLLSKLLRHLRRYVFNRLLKQLHQRMRCAWLLIFTAKRHGFISVAFFLCYKPHGFA